MDLHVIFFSPTYRSGDHLLVAVSSSSHILRPWLTSVLPSHAHLQNVARGRRPLVAMAIASRQHPLLLWLDAAGFEGSLSLGAYYLLLFACAWFVLRRGRAWARSRSFLAGASKKSEAADGMVGGDKPPQLTYVDSPRNRRLLARTSFLARPYKPSPWLGHRVSGNCTMH